MAGPAKAEVVVNEPTRVRINLGYTRNMGNFESLRVDIGVDDSRREGESVVDCFSRVYSFVEAKLMEKVNEAEAEINNTKG